MKIFKRILVLIFVVVIGFICVLCISPKARDWFHNDVLKIEQTVEDDTTVEEDNDLPSTDPAPGNDHLETEPIE